MDPASVAGLVVLAGQIANSIYGYGRAVRTARRDIDQLCIDLFALKGTLEHVRLHIESCKWLDEDEQSSASQSTLSSQIFNTDEFNDMLSSTDGLLRDLYGLLGKAANGKRAFVQGLLWPLAKSEVQQYMARLEKLKSYFILAITSDNLEVSKQIYLELHSLGQLVRHQQDRQDEKEGDERRKLMARWLAPFDPSELHWKALQARQAGTGSWLLDDSLPQWVDGEKPRVFWLRGRSGVGKTSLISAAVDQVERRLSDQKPGHSSAYFYCSFTDQLSQDPRNVFGSLIAQLCHANPTLWHHIGARYDTYRLNTQNAPQLEISALKGTLKLLCSSLSKVFLFVDGPNESAESSLIISALWDIVRETEGVHIMISSTEDVTMSPSQLDDQLLFTVSMEPEQLEADIEDYVTIKLQKDENLRHLPNSLKKDIRASLVNKSDGVFRWVQCQFESLADRKTPKSIRKALASIPQTLSETYCNMLTRIAVADRALAKQVLMWLTFAPRTLTFPELAEAVIIDDDDIDLTTIDEEDRLLRPTDLLNICRSLISFNPSSNHVILAHSSVRVYLTSSEVRDGPASYFFLDPSEAQRMLMQKCLTYLCFSDFACGYSDLLDATLYARHPLLHYAVSHWPTHAIALQKANIEPDSILCTLLLRFFATASLPRNGNFGAWIQLYLPDADLRVVKSAPLYYAARFGLLSLVRLILNVEGTKDLEAVGGRGDSTPLHVASAYGHTPVVKVLLEAGADPRAVNSKKRTGLTTAAENGDVEIVRLLLAAGADANHQTSTGKRALYLSIMNMETECVEALKAAGADVTDVDGSGTSAEELQQLVNETIPPGKRGFLRRVPGPDPSGIIPNAGEAVGVLLETKDERRYRKQLATRLRHTMYAKTRKASAQSVDKSSKSILEREMKVEEH